MTNRRQIIAVTVVLTALHANAVFADADDQTPGQKPLVQPVAVDGDHEERRLKLAVMGLSAVGILGLLWVRRHTSEP